ncbi:hypothetical protein VTK56DRAFT_5061 [Thermocarpiscus australiensis]
MRGGTPTSRSKATWDSIYIPLCVHRLLHRAVYPDVCCLLPSCPAFLRVSLSTAFATRFKPGVVLRLVVPAQASLPLTTMPAAPDTALDWAAYRSRIEDLYWTQHKELPEVMKTMEDLYGFAATKKMYKKHLKAWGLEKNIKTSEMIAMIEIARRRRLQNKGTLFVRRGKPVDPGKLRRFAKRRGLLVADGAAASLSDQQVATPPNITYTTPEPDNAESPPPVPQSYDDQETMESYKSVAEASKGAHSSGHCGNSPSCSTSCASSIPASWNTYVHSQSASTHPVVDDHAPLSLAFLALQASDVSHDLPGVHFSTPCSPIFWFDGSEDTGYHAYPAPTNGPPSWNLVPQPKPDTVHDLDSPSSRIIPVFPSSHDSDIAHATLVISDADKATNPIYPCTARASLDHTALHDAVIDNNYALAKALLEDGANANCTARGGMTPLHYASYQRNVGLVQLLRDYGSKLDAMTDKRRSILHFAVGSQRCLGDSDMLAYAYHDGGDNSSHTDEDTMNVIDALYSSPAGWTHLLRSLDQADEDGVTPLMMAAEGGFTKTVITFLQRGARPDLSDHAGHTALRYAASNSHRHLVRLLLEADARVQAHDLSHLLKLASRNFTGRAATDHGLRGMEGWWDACHGSSSAIIAEEMVRLCREMGVLDGLLRLAEQKRKDGVLELLLGAMTQLDMEEGP